MSGVYVAGTRTFAAEVVDFAIEAGLDVLGLLEPHDEARIGTTVHELPVISLDAGPPAAEGAVLLGTGERGRREVAERLRASGWEIARIVHPDAHVARSATIGEGAIVAPGVVVGARARIGECVVVGRGSLVGHHTEVDAFATLGPGVNVAGNVRVEEDAFVAMGAVVRDHLIVGAGAVVAMGAVVVNDVPPGVEVRGLPAR